MLKDTRMRYKNQFYFYTLAKNDLKVQLTIYNSIKNKIFRNKFNKSTKFTL